jgi:hypothetical protein
MASQSHRMCVADSSSCRHLSQVGSSVRPSLKRCPLRWQCPMWMWYLPLKINAPYLESLKIVKTIKTSIFLLGAVVPLSSYRCVWIRFGHSHVIREVAHTTQWNRFSKQTHLMMAHIRPKQREMINVLHCGRKCSVWINTIYREVMLPVWRARGCLRLREC